VTPEAAPRAGRSRAAPGAPSRPPARLLRLAFPAALLAALLAFALAAGLADARLAASAEGRWSLAMAGLAALVLAWALRQGRAAWGLLAALWLLAGMGALWLTEPLWFPAPRLRPQGPADLAMMGLVAAEGLAALLVLLRARPGARPGARMRADLAWLLAGFGPLRLLVFLLLTAAFAVSPMGFLGTGDLAGYAVKLVAAAGFAGISLLGLLALAGLPAPELPFAPMRLSPVLPALVAFAASALLARYGLQAVPHVEDELAYLFQARTYAAGAFWTPAPPEAARAGLDYYLLDVSGGRWFSPNAPGWPALLALGVRAGVPWLVNPLLAGASVLLAHRVTALAAGRARAGLVAILLAASPWLIGTAASLMTHMLCLALVLAAWALLLGARQARGFRAAAPAFLAGAALGWVFLTRPLEGLVAGGLTGLWLLAARVRAEGWRGWPAVLGFGLGCLATGALVFPYNALFTGDPLLAPLSDYIARLWGGGANAFGFGPGIGPPGGWGALDLAPGHSPAEGLVNTLNNLNGLSLELFGWGTGSLALVWALLLWGRPAGLDRAMLVLAGLVILVHVPYWFAGSFYIGPRYWFIAVFGLVVLSAGGAFAVRDRVAALGLDAQRLVPLLALLVLWGLAGFTSWRGVTKYYAYRTFTDRFRVAAEAGAYGNALVFVGTDGDVGAALFLNDPFLAPDRPVFLRDLGPEQNAAAIAAFPGRQVIHVQEDVKP
jgi:hypothetical protein